MKRIVILVIVLIGCVALWRLGSRLSADAVGMAVGVLLGVLASIPTSLLILVSRQRSEREDVRWERPTQERTQPAYQPPVIVLAGHTPAVQQPMITSTSPATSADHGWMQRNTTRQFKIIGEVDQQ